MQRMLIMPHQLSASQNPAVVADQKINLLVRKPASSQDLFALARRMPPDSVIRINFFDRYNLTLNQDDLLTRQKLISAIAQAYIAEPRYINNREAALQKAQRDLTHIEKIISEEMIFRMSRYMSAVLSREDQESVQPHRVTTTISFPSLQITSAEEGFNITRQGAHVAHIQEPVVTTFDRITPDTWALDKIETSGQNVLRFLLSQQAPALSSDSLGVIPGNPDAFAAYNNENRRSNTETTEREISRRYQQYIRTENRKAKLSFPLFMLSAAIMVGAAVGAVLLASLIWPVPLLAIAAIALPLMLYAPTAPDPESRPLLQPIARNPAAPAPANSHSVVRKRTGSAPQLQLQQPAQSAQHDNEPVVLHGQLEEITKPAQPNFESETVAFHPEEPTQVVLHFNEKTSQKNIFGSPVKGVTLHVTEPDDRDYALASFRQS